MREKPQRPVGPPLQSRRLPRLTLGQFIGVCFLGLAILLLVDAVDLLRGIAPHDPARFGADHGAGEPAA